MEQLLSENICFRVILQIKRWIPKHYICVCSRMSQLKHEGLSYTVTRNYYELNFLGIMIA